MPLVDDERGLIARLRAVSRLMYMMTLRNTQVSPHFATAGLVRL